MDPEKARALTDAVVRTNHPRNDFRTDEAKRYTRWMEEYAREWLTPGGRLLDLGCAAGKQTFQAEQLGAQVVGLDCAGEALRLALAIAADTGSRARFIRAVYAGIPFAADCFDTVLFPKNLVECSYAEAEALANDIARILKPGGRLILTLPDSLARFIAHPEWLENYDPQSGRLAARARVPGQGEFENSAYFWTCGFAAHVFGRNLHLDWLQQMENSTTIMVFSKTPQAH